MTASIPRVTATQDWYTETEELVRARGGEPTDVSFIRHARSALRPTDTTTSSVLRVSERATGSLAMVGACEDIVRLSEQPEVQGVLVEVEDHTKNERVVVMRE